MTVAELIEVLEREENKERPVVFSYNYGDHWRTTVAEEINNIEELTLVYSDYHSMWKVPDEDELEKIEAKERAGTLRDKIQTAIVLS
jgi:hypothetical protein